MYEAGTGHATGTGAPVAGGSRPWLAEDGCFQDVVASLPGGSTLAQVLPALLAMEPASITPDRVACAGGGSMGVGQVPRGAGVDEEWSAETAERTWLAGSPDALRWAEESALDQGPTGEHVPAPWSGDAVGPAWGPGDGLPVWLTALQQCLEPLSAVATVPAAVGSAPGRPGPVPAGGLVDPARAERQEDRAAEALAAMSIAAVVEVVAGFKRIEAWAASQAARAAAQLASRPELRPDVRRPIPARAAHSAALRAPTLAATALAKRLGTSERAAGLLVHAGLALTGTLYATGDALDRGAIDFTKATIIATALAAVPWQVAHAVEDKVLPTAPARTPGLLRQDLAKALLEVDPEDAAARHDRARRERRVERPVALPDGMALVRAVLPADAATRLDATLQAAAAAAKAAGDPRIMDQLRADALDALAMQAWHAGAIEPPHGRMRLSHSRMRAQINVTVDLTTLLGLTETPGHLAGYGPIDADMARRLSRDGTWRRLITDPVNGLVVDVSTRRYRPPANLDELIRLRHPTCIDPVCSVPSDRCDIDHQATWTLANPDTSAGNLGPLCRTHHLHKTHAGAAYLGTEPGFHEITTPTGHRYRTGPPVQRDDPGEPPPPF